MIRVLQYGTSAEAYLDLYNKMLGNDPTFIEKGIAGYNYRQWTRDVIIEVEKPTALPLNIVGFSLGRWTKFMTEYFDMKTFKNFLVFLKERRYNDAQEYAYICSSHARHSLGNCLFGLTVKTGRSPRVSLVSRSCNLVPTGILDLSLGSLMAGYVANILGVESCPLVWQINHLQINSWPALLLLIQLNMASEKVLNPLVPFQGNMLQVYRWSKTGHLPSLKYQFYLRYMNKIQKAEIRRQEGIKVFPLIPVIPPKLYPNGGILHLPTEEDFYKIPNPYDPIGARITGEEHSDSRTIWRTPPAEAIGSLEGS